eukprot:45343-Eustigmatos_ZCMA.PRE.1
MRQRAPVGFLCCPSSFFPRVLFSYQREERSYSSQSYCDIASMDYDVWDKRSKEINWREGVQNVRSPYAPSRVCPSPACPKGA